MKRRHGQHEEVEVEHVQRTEAVQFPLFRAVDVHVAEEVRAAQVKEHDAP